MYSIAQYHLLNSQCRFLLPYSTVVTPRGTYVSDHKLIQTHKINLSLSYAWYDKPSTSRYRQIHVSILCYYVTPVPTKRSWREYYINCQYILGLNGGNNQLHSQNLHRRPTPTENRKPIFSISKK